MYENRKKLTAKYTHMHVNNELHYTENFNELDKF